MYCLLPRKRLLPLVASLLLALASQAPAATLYTNGPIDGSDDAQAIDVPTRQAVSDVFTLEDAASLASADVGLWVRTGLTPTALSWEVGTTPFGSDISTGTATLSNTFHNSTDNGDYSVYDSAFTLSGLLPSAGTYYFTLYNATSGGGDVYWDVNGGPSTAYVGVGSMGEDPQQRSSESFTLFGANVPEPSTWAMMLSGLGLLGLALRFRRASSF